MRCTAPVRSTVQPSSKFSSRIWLDKQTLSDHRNSVKLDFGHFGIDLLQTRQGRAGAARKFSEVEWECRPHEMTEHCRLLSIKALAGSRFADL